MANKNDLLFENPFGSTSGQFVCPKAASQGIIWKNVGGTPDFVSPEARDTWSRIKDVTVKDMMGFAGFSDRGGRPGTKVLDMCFKDSDFIGQILGKHLNMDYPKNVWTCCCTC